MEWFFFLYRSTYIWHKFGPLCLSVAESVWDNSFLLKSSMFSTLDKGSKSGALGNTRHSFLCYFHLLFPSVPESWKRSITQILSAIASSPEHTWNWLKGQGRERTPFWQCDQLRFVFILRNVSLQIFTGMKVDSCSPLCTRVKLEFPSPGD